MKKTKLLAALLLCTAVALPIKAYSAERTFEGSYQGISQPTQNGGAIFNNTGDTAIVKAGTQFINNEAKRGAGIYNYAGGNLNIEDGVKFDNNRAVGAAGGAIQNFGTAVMGDNLVFENNKAAWGGAAIYAGSNSNGGHSTTIGSGAIFRNNTLTDNASYGGAIFVENDNKTDTAIFNLGSDSTFENNSAMHGGAVYIKEAVNAEIASGAKFIGNNATELGGAIYNGGNLTVAGTFTGNTANHGGAIFNDTGAKATIGENSLFNNNTSVKGGGAIKNYTGAELVVNDGTQFLSNSTEAGGGAIQNMGTATLGNNLVFDGNKAQWGGAAIYGGSRAGVGSSTVIGDNARFTNNTLTNTGTNSDSVGGAVFIESDEGQNVEFTLGKDAYFGNNSANQGGAIYLKQGTIAATIGEGATFDSNSATTHGGAIFTRTALDLQGATFNNNSAGIQGGAIITTRTAEGLLNIEGSTFKGNTAGEEGGAIWSGAETKIANSLFESNKTTGTVFGNEDYNIDSEGGGAIFVGSSSKTAIEGSTFTNNQSGTVGGAIATRSNAKNDGSSSLEITSSSFDGNKASVNGGAIAAYIDSTITDTNFTNNTAGSKGGAVWTNQNLTVNAVNSDIIMAGNKASDGADIFMNKEGSNLNINANEGKSITVASGISGNENGYNMLVNSNGGTGSLVINSAIQNAAIDVQNGTFHLAQGSALNNSTLNMAGGTTLNTINNQISSFGDNVTLQDNVNLAVDVNLANGKADNFGGANVQGKVTITDVNTLGNTTANGVSINLAEALGIDPNNMAISEALQNQTQRVLTPIRYLQGGISETGMLTMAPTGNSYKDFNPAVMASPVAAQLGGYLTQLNSYDQAFRNMDMYMLMTKKQREAMKLRNKYAAADSNLIFDPTGSAYDDKAVWVRPYATFENVPLKNGPKVSNVAYGSFFGADSELYDLGHGWDGMLSVYAGYNGSHQAYDGIGIYQNGGTLGITGMAYKGNFFTGLTLNAGANVGEANTAYGNDNFTMLMAGIANKTGYNIELADGKFIIQPNVQLSYSFVNTFDYTNAAGVKMNSDPLNAIQVEPGIKFIGNLKNGWQPYAGISVVWNIMDKTNFHANNVSLPELSVKPYVRYGVGVKKTWGEVCTGFLQTYFTNGGRNGVGIQGGFRFTLGKGGLSSIKTSNNMPELPATKIMLSNGGR